MNSPPLQQCVSTERRSLVRIPNAPDYAFVHLSRPHQQLRIGRRTLDLLGAETLLETYGLSLGEPKLHCLLGFHRERFHIAVKLLHRPNPRVGSFTLTRSSSTFYVTWRLWFETYGHLLPRDSGRYACWWQDNSLIIDCTRLLPEENRVYE